jgi:uncharacterized protein YggE
LLPYLGPMKNGLVVSAIGRAFAPPDRASINLGVSAVKPEAGAALSEVGRKVGELIETLTSHGVAREAVQTADLSLWGETDRNGNPAGYRARNSVNLSVDDVARLGEILGASLAAIGNGAEMHGIGFEIREPDQVAQTARDRAFASAVAKATQLAALAGRGLGQVVSIIETEGSASSPHLLAKMAVADSVPVEAGTTAVTVNLTVRFALI